MAIAYDWTIPSCEHDIATGGINVVHWRCTASETVGENTYSASSYGTVGLTPDPSSPDFTPYADITEAKALEWTKTALGAEEVASIEANVAAQLELLKDPVGGSGAPWGSHEDLTPFHDAIAAF